MVLPEMLGAVDVVDTREHLPMQTLDVVGLAEPVADDLPVARQGHRHQIVAVELVEPHPRDVLRHPLQEEVEWTGVARRVDEDEGAPRVHRHREQPVLLRRQRSETPPRGHLAQPAGEIPRPAVERTPQLGQPGGRPLADGAAPVPAHVLERPQHGVAVPHDDNRVGTAAVLVGVARLGHVVGRTGQLPHPGPQPLELQLSEGRVGVARGRDGDGLAVTTGDGGADRCFIGEFSGQFDHRSSPPGRVGHL